MSAAGLPFNAESWTALIRRTCPGVVMGAPASPESLLACEDALDVALPSALRGVLDEADGVTAVYSTSIIWPVHEIIRRNRELRETGAMQELYMPFNHLLFFGDDGSGDLFAYAVNANGRIERDDIFLWQHESDSRTWFAPRLESYLERQLREIAG